MKKILLTLIAILLSFSYSNAQEVKFLLQGDGNFLTAEGKDFAVAEFEGKTAMELYNMVKNNVMSMFNSPKDVLSENEGQSMTIHAYNKYFATKTITLIPRSFGAKYSLTIKFKDGRIRVEAPVVTGGLVDNNGLLIPSAIPSYSSLIKGWFNKDGSRKEKKIKDIEFCEYGFNNTINTLLGYKQKTNKEEEDW